MTSEMCHHTVQVSRAQSFVDADDYDEALAEEDGLTAERAGLRPPVCPRCSPLRRSAALLRRRAPPPGLQGTWGSRSPPF